MKKIMIAFVVVAMAACSQAANWKWQTATTSGGPVYAYGGAATLASAVAYIFADGLQESVYNQWVADGTMKAGSLDNSTVTAGAIAAKTDAGVFTTSNTGANQNFFFAIIDADKNLFISATKGGAESDLAGGNTLKFSAKTTSTATPFKAGAEFSGAGWYTAAPEPTSGLLLLLGVAGLALRRRRA